MLENKSIFQSDAPPGQSSLSLAFCPPAAHGQTQSVASTTLSTSNVRLELAAGKQSPRVVRIKSPAGFLLTNKQEETLPATIEFGGATVPLVWQHKPSLDHADAQHVVLRLRVRQSSSAAALAMGSPRQFRSHRALHSHRKSQRATGLAPHGRLAPPGSNYRCKQGIAQPVYRKGRRISLA